MNMWSAGTPSSSGLEVVDGVEDGLVAVLHRLSFSRAARNSHEYFSGNRNPSLALAWPRWSWPQTSDDQQGLPVEDHETIALCLCRTDVGLDPCGSDRALVHCNGDREATAVALDLALSHASTGPKLDFQLQGSRHRTYSDVEALRTQLGRPPAQLPAIISTIDPGRAFTIETAYVTSFFDPRLRRRDNHLLDGQSTQFPEMVFQP